MNIPTSLYTAEQVRELDRIAIHERGMPGIRLMCRAGEAVFEVIRSRWPESGRMQVFCGLGNNAGDGYVVARLGKAAGWQVQVIQLGDASKLTGDALLAMQDWQSAGGKLEPFYDDLVIGSDVLVDALFGTGLGRPLEGDWALAVSKINGRTAGSVVTVDIPSGLQANTGVILGEAVKADITVTFIGVKQGMYTAHGPDHCGEILFDDLEIPSEILDQVVADVVRFDGADANQWLKPRDRAVHKGDFGHVLIAGGDTGMAGAARMAAEAALRAGAGIVSIATRESHASLIGIGCPELMCNGAEDAAALNRLMGRVSVMALGPGLGQSEWAHTMFDAALTADMPLVLDADALNLLSQQPASNENWVLTPHPGEAARLLGCSTSDIQADRFTAVREISAKYGGVCVLKGNGTLVAKSGIAVHLLDTGNPGMASGGMGDVLTGVIGALIAQGLNSFEAATCGCWVHGRAGDIAARTGERGMRATDVINQLRVAVNPETQ